MCSARFSVYLDMDRKTYGQRDMRRNRQLDKQMDI